MVWGCKEANHQEGAAVGFAEHWEAAAVAGAPFAVEESSSFPLHLHHLLAETDAYGAEGAWHHLAVEPAVAGLEFPFLPSQLLAAEEVQACSPGSASVE